MMLGEILSSVMDNYFAGQRQEDAQQFSAQQFATRYQTTVKDLQSAGLNPMLAYTQGGPSAPTSSAASAGNSFSQGYATYQQSKLNSAQIARANSESSLIDEQRRGVEIDNAIKERYGMDRANAELNNTISATGLNLEMQGKVIQETENLAQALSNMKTDQEKVNAMISNLQEQNKLLQKQGLSEVQRAAVLNAQARLYSAQAKMENFDVEAVIKSGGVGRLAREVKPVSDIASDWLSPGKWIDKMLPNLHKKVK